MTTMRNQDDRPSGIAIGVVVIALAAAATATVTLARSAPTPSGRIIRLETRPIDLNAASAEELALLPGIGPHLAARIVEDRARNGPYRSLEDLARVRGVGPVILQGIADEAIVGTDGAR